MSFLSIHAQRLDPQVIQVMRDSPNTTAVKLVDPGEEDVFPDKLKVVRLYDREESRLAAEGAQGADTWWERHRGQVAARPWISYLETGDNEIYDKELSDQQIEMRVDYRLRLIDLIKTDFPQIKALAGNWARGTPEPYHAHHFRRLAQVADALGFHEYWYEDGPHGPRAFSWTVQRYRRFFGELGFQVESWITEAGMALGDPLSWRSIGMSEADYLAQCKEYRDEASSDAYIRGIFVFTYGGGHTWRNFDLSADIVRRMVDDNPAPGPAAHTTPEITVPEERPTGAVLPRIAQVILPIKNIEKAWYTADKVFGPYDGHPERCRDLNLETFGNTDLGEPLVAPFHGLVITARDLGGGWGRVVRILGLEADGGCVVWMGAHMDQVHVREGQIVTCGQDIGTVGNSGTEHAHLHEQIAVDEVPPERTHGMNTRYQFVNPYKFYAEHGVDMDLLNRTSNFDSRDLI